MSSFASIATHAALRSAFALSPSRITAGLLVRFAHAAPHATVAAVRRWKEKAPYRERVRANRVARGLLPASALAEPLPPLEAPAPPPPPFVFHNLHMAKLPEAFVQLGADPTGRRTTSQVLEAALEAALASGASAKALGAGYGFSDAAATGGWLVQSPGLDAVSSNVTKGPNGEPLLTIEAGATINQINAAIDRINAATSSSYGFVNQPGFGGLTFAGAAAAGGHGSSLKWGALADAIQSIRMLCVNASRKPRWVQIEPSPGSKPPNPGPLSDPATFSAQHPGVALLQDDAMFRACIVAIGCMGIIHSMTIELRPIKTLTETRKLMTWSDAKSTWPELVAQCKDPRSDLHSFVYWLNPYPTLGEQRVVVATYYERGGPPSGERPPVITSIGGSLALEEVTVAIANWLPDLVPWLVDAAIEAAQDENVVMDSPVALCFGAPNNLNVSATACGVPLHDAIATVEGLSAALQRFPHKLTSTFGLRFTPKARGLLAPQGAGDTCIDRVPVSRGHRRPRRHARGVLAHHGRGNRRASALGAAQRLARRRATPQELRRRCRRRLRPRPPRARPDRVLRQRAHTPTEALKGTRH